jgi:hypothetical protein
MIFLEIKLMIDIVNINADISFDFSPNELI